MGIAFEAAVKDENNIYFWDMNHNAFCKVNLYDHECRYITYDKRYGIKTERLYGLAKKNGDKYVFAPMYADHIAVFDSVNENMSYYDVDVHENVHANAKEKFFSIETFGDYAYMLGSGCSCLIRLNMHNGEINKYDDWKDCFRFSIENKKDLFISSVITESGEIIAPACYENRILEYDVNTDNWKVYTVPNHDKGFSGICYDGECFWLAPMEGNVLVRWNKNQDTYESIKLPFNSGENSVQYGGCIYLRDSVVLQKSWKKELLIVKSINDKTCFEECIVGKGNRETVKSYRPIPLTAIDIDTLLACDYTSGKAYVVNVKDLSRMQEFSTIMNGINELYEGYDWKNGDIIRENDTFGLPFLIHQLAE